MQIIIEGMNRTEFCKPKSQDVDSRRFYATRGQLYRAYPDQFTRMRIYEYGVETGTDEVIVYQENSIHPRVIRGTNVDYEKMMADIDEHKIMSGPGLVKKSPFGLLSSRTISKLYTMGPMLLVGIVLLYAFLANGGHL